MIWFLILSSSLGTEFLRIRPIIFNRDVHTAISASRWTTSGKTSFFRRNYGFQYILGFSRLWVWTFSEKKIRTFRAALNVSVCKKGWKNVFIGLASILHICSNCDGNTLDFSAKTFLLGSPNCLVRVSTKNSNEVTFFWTFQFQFFFRILGRKFTAVLSKTNSTRPGERMKNDVLIRGSLIPEKVSAIWRRYFGFSLKHFSMVGDTAIYAFRERIQYEIFRNIFVS